MSVSLVRLYCEQFQNQCAMQLNIVFCWMATFVLIMNAVFLTIKKAKDVSCIFYDSAMAPKVLLNKYFFKQWRPRWNAA